MKNFFKKPLNIVSFLLAVLGLVGIVVMLVVPHGRTYTTTAEVAGEEVEARLVLKDGKIYTGTKIDGEWKEASMGEYEVSKGKLSYKVPATGLSVELGKINTFRFVPTDAEEDIKYTCKMTVVFFTIACVMLVVGAAGMVYGSVSSKKKKK